MCVTNGANGAEQAFKVEVNEMSGKGHEIEGLYPSTSIAELLQQVSLIISTKKGVRLGLIHGDKLLASRQGSTKLTDLGIFAGTLLAVVQVNSIEYFEFTGQIDDEDPGSESSVRVCLLDESTCVLVRHTNTRIFYPWDGTFHVRQTWDIGHGAYTNLDACTVACAWQKQYRRLRTGITENERLTRVTDSGWIVRKEVPEAWRQIQLEGGKWRKNADELIDGDHILGIRLTGRGSAEEALRMLALV